MKTILLVIFSSLFLAVTSNAQSIDSIPYYLNNYQPQKAIAIIDVQLEENPKNSKLHYLKALALKDIYDISGALKFSKNAIDLNPNQISYWFLLADIYSISGNIEEGILAYKNILAIDSTILQAQFKLANLYFKKTFLY